MRLALVGLYLILASFILAQEDHSLKDRFRREYVDRTGAALDSLPTFDDSVFVWKKAYEFEGVDAKGKETGLEVFDDQTLNLSLKLGEEEDREVGKVTGAFYWLVNNLAKIASLTFYNPDLGANRYYFANEILREDLKLIRSLYEEQGYFEARIVKYKAVFSDDRRKVKVKVFIYEGKPTTLADDPKITVVSSIPLVDFRNELGEKDVNAQLVLAKGSNLSRENLEIDKGTIQKLYAKKGYSSTEVSEVIDTSSSGPYKALVEFKVIPGRYTVFGKTTVSGNYYRAEAKVDTTKPVVTDTTKKIVEDEVILLKVKYKEGKAFDPDRLALTVGQINGLGVFRSVKPLMQKGRAHVDTSAEAKTRTSLVMDSLKQHSGNRLIGKRLEIEDFGIPVDTVHINFSVSERKERSIKPGIGFTTDFTDLPENESAGFAPFLILQLSWQSKNFFGGARKLQFSGQLSKGFKSPFRQDSIARRRPYFANYMQAKITFRQPSFRIPIANDVENDLLITLAAERNNTRAYDVVTLEASPTFIRQFNTQISLNLTPFSFVRRELLRTDAESPDLVFFTTNTRAGITYNSANDFFYPSGGFTSYLTSDFAGFLLPSDLKYMKLNLDNRKYFGFGRRWSMAMRARAGVIIPYDVDGHATTIPVSEQYYAGGPNSIRGWGIKELGPIQAVEGSASRIVFLGGNSILEGGLECRYNMFLSRNPNDAIAGMDLAAFADIGNVWTEYNFTNYLDDLPAQPVAAVGLGMRLRTLIGPVRIDVGYKLVNINNLKVINANGEGPDDDTVTKITKKQLRNISPIGVQITLGQAY